MRYKLILLTLVVVCVFEARGQAEKSVPGFLGSRNAVSVKVMPNFTLGDQIFQQLVTPAVLFNYERALSRRSSITLSAGRQKSLFFEEGVYKFEDGRNNKLMIIVDGNPTKVIFRRGYMRYRNTSFSIAKSYYNLRRGSIAPQGKFFKLGLTMNFMKIEEDSFTYTLNDYSTFNNTGKTYNTLSMGSLNLELGSKRFITTHLFFQKAFAFNIPFNFWTTSTNKTYYNVEDYNETNLAFFTSVIQTCNFSLAFGYAF